MPCFNPFSLENKIVLITMASSEIGRATAIECSRMGAKVIITARDNNRLEQTYAQLSGTGHQKLSADLTVTKDIEKLVDAIDQINGLVYNVGIHNMPLPQFVNEKKLGAILQFNAVAPVVLTQKLLKKKKLQKGSSIVFTSPANTTYHGFTINITLDLMERGIRCNSVSSGTAEETAYMIVYLLSDAASSVNGTSEKLGKQWSILH